MKGQYKGKITIVPNGDGGWRSEEVAMPLGFRYGEDGKVYITLINIGNIVTIAENDSDVIVAVVEAVDGFLHASQEFGKGIIQEFKLCGWEQTVFEPNTKREFTLTLK